MKNLDFGKTGLLNSKKKHFGETMTILNFLKGILILVLTSTGMT